MKTAVIATMLALATFITSARAGEPDAAAIPADTKWVAHVDVQKLVTSRLGKFVIEKANAKGLQERLAEVRDAIGTDLLADVKGLTLFGVDYGEQNWVVMLDAKMDQEKTVKLLGANEAYERLTEGDYTIHRWTDPKAKARNMPAVRFGCFHDENRTVVAADLDRLKATLAVLDGKADSLASDKERAATLADAKGAILYINATDVKIDPEQAKPRAALLATMIGRLTLSVSEVEDNLVLRVAVGTKDEQEARKMAATVNGLVALATLAIDQEAIKEQPRPGALEAAQLLGKVSVMADAATVRISADWPVATLEKLIEAKAAQLDQLKADKKEQQ